MRDETRPGHPFIRRRGARAKPESYMYLSYSFYWSSCCTCISGRFEGGFTTAKCIMGMFLGGRDDQLGRPCIRLRGARAWRASYICTIVFSSFLSSFFKCISGVVKGGVTTSKNIIGFFLRRVTTGEVVRGVHVLDERHISILVDFCTGLPALNVRKEVFQGASTTAKSISGVLLMGVTTSEVVHAPVREVHVLDECHTCT